MKKSIYAVIILTAIVGALGYEYVSNQPSKPTTKPALTAEIETPRGIKAAGYVDPKRLIEADIYGDEFSQLDEREHIVRMELQNAMRPITIEEPTVEAKPFDDSVWQKNAQTIISQAAEIGRRKKQAAEDYKNATEADYLKRRDEINNQFLNEILNINLKLQNAKVMRLTNEELNALQARLEELQQERGQIQEELEKQWILEINEHAEEAIKEDVAQLQAQARESMDRVKLQAQADREAAQARDRAVMEKSRALTARRELLQSLSNELEEILEQRRQLEAQLLKDIDDETARLAVVHGLDFILLKRDVDATEKFFPFDFNENLSVDLMPSKEKFGSAFFPTSKTIDLTDDIIKELRRRKE